MASRARRLLMLAGSSFFMHGKLLGRPDAIITSGSHGVELVSNAFRPSSAKVMHEKLYGPSAEYKTEEWKLDYHSVDEYQHVSRLAVTCLLPEGYEKAFLERGDASLKRGPIYKVRAWGIEFAARYLEGCKDYLTVRNAKTKNVVERAMWDLRAIGWELPGHFIIASEDHPLTATSPSRKEYVYDSWCRLYNAIEIMKEAESNGKDKKRKGSEI